MADYFKTNKHHPEYNGSSDVQPYADASDFSGNDGLTISFQHVPSAKAVWFKAFITAFNESYSCDWASEDVFGRADPIFMFKKTTRKISLTFSIPSATEGEGYENLAALQSLTKFLYPVYADIQNALTISQSPLLRLRVLNLLQNRGPLGTGYNQKSFEKYFKTEGDGDPFKGGWVDGQYTPTNGVLGVLHSLNINHIVDDPTLGVYEGGPRGARTVIPRMIQVSCDFTVIHEHHLGWAQGQNGHKHFSVASFPYGVQDTTGLSAHGGSGPGGSAADWAQSTGRNLADDAARNAANLAGAPVGGSAASLAEAVGAVDSGDPLSQAGAYLDYGTEGGGEGESQPAGEQLDENAESTEAPSDASTQAAVDSQQSEYDAATSGNNPALRSNRINANRESS